LVYQGGATDPDFGLEARADPLGSLWTFGHGTEASTCFFVIKLRHDKKFRGGGREAMQGG
jgi:hypothetical protein